MVRNLVDASGGSQIKWDLYFCRSILPSKTFFQPKLKGFNLGSHINFSRVFVSCRRTSKVWRPMRPTPFRSSRPPAKKRSREAKRKARKALMPRLLGISEIFRECFASPNTIRMYLHSLFFLGGSCNPYFMGFKKKHVSWFWGPKIFFVFYHRCQCWNMSSVMCSWSCHWVSSRHGHLILIFWITAYCAYHQQTWVGNIEVLRYCSLQTKKS